MSFEIGQTVGPYRIAAAASRGGMGQVFQVEHIVTRRVEAMKVLLDDRADEQQAARFLREIQVQAGLDHPNIAAVHNAFWEGDRLVMIMEWVEGESLEQILGYGRLPLPVAIRYATQALAALGYAHEHGVTHRDVKPANMLVTAAGVLKLTDFGLARAATDRRLSQSGVPIGSCYYMSPEQVRGLAAPDHRSDLYSLGVVLYEMAAGHRPFESGSAFDLMTAHVQQVPRPPSELAPELPPVLNDAILRALAKEPDKRFASAEAFRTALEGTATPGPVRQAARTWRLAAVAASLALAILVGTNRRRTASPAPAPPPAPDATTAWQPPPPRRAVADAGAAAPIRSRAPSLPAGETTRSLPPPELPARLPSVATPPPLREPAVTASPAPSPPATHAPQLTVVTLPEGTRLVVRVDEAVSTSTHHAGDLVAAHLEEPLEAAGRLIAPAGAKVEARVVEAVDGGLVAGRARLSVELCRLHAAGGAVVPIATSVVEREARGVRSRMILLKRTIPAAVSLDTVLDFQLRSPVRIVATRLPNPGLATAGPPR